TVSGARLENVDALVIERGLDTSLLGMTFLGRLASFQATRQALILRP
ncbi:MAG: TIGR02281 family clan AA aspartic protease, partial [Caulobacterales bacterium]